MAEDRVRTATPPRTCRERERAAKTVGPVSPDEGWEKERWDEEGKVGLGIEGGGGLGERDKLKKIVGVGERESGRESVPVLER
jgi:hypothetical protein